MKRKHIGQMNQRTFLMPSWRNLLEQRCIYKIFAAGTKAMSSQQQGGLKGHVAQD